jgi:hypothetical protein
MCYGLKMVIFKLLFRKEVSTMAEVYVALIIKGKRTFSQVPAIIQPKVKELLEALDLAELAE